MNCRPGDVARIVGTCPHLRINDRFVKLANEPCFLLFGVVHWRLEETLETQVACDGYNIFTGEFIPAGSIGLIVEIPDENLRPIRGDGVTDGEVRELYEPAPSTAEVREVA